MLATAIRQDHLELVTEIRSIDPDSAWRAVLAAAGEGDGAVRALLERPEVAEIHAHTQALGCFLARIERN